jgi:predicted RNA binding protein YcfA (HicA-like mRNA interferase family)
MKSLSGRDFARHVERHGWTLQRVNGNHHNYGKQGSVARLSIPIHGNRALKVGLLRSLMKAAQIAEQDID